MHHHLRLAFTRLLVVLVIGSTTACSLTSAPAHDALLAAAPQSIPTATTPAAATLHPTTVLPPNFTIYQTTFFQLGLPPGWEARDIATIDTDVLVQQLNHTLPPLTRVISTSVALPITYGWAGQPTHHTADVAAMALIQGIPLDLRHVIPLQSLLLTIYDLYHQAGVTTTRIERGLVIDQHDAAKLRSTILLTLGAATPTETETYHYFIRSDQTLWILTYVIDAHQFAQFNPLILQSVKSFHIRKEAEAP